MSGLEALGVAASIIQVADLGTKLSVQLFSLYRRVKSANDSIQLLSNEVALVSAILRELGENLKEEESSKLCSDEAFRTLGLVLNQCRDVLGQIQKVVDDNDRSGKGRFQQITGKFRIVILEPSLNQLQLNLERLKSTMLLLLNVITYAGQIRSNNVPTLVQEQRDFLQSLLEDTRNDIQRPQQSDMAAESSRDLAETTSNRPAHTKIHETAGQKSDSKADLSTLKDKSSQGSIEYSSSSEARTEAHIASENNESIELEEYNRLIQRMLNEIELCKNKLESNRQSRIKSGVLNIHSREIMQFQMEYGRSIRIDHSLFDEKRPENKSNGESTSPPLPQKGLHQSSQSTEMHVDSWIGSDDSELSETDIFIRNRKDRTSSHRRPETKETNNKGRGQKPRQVRPNVYDKSIAGEKRPSQQSFTSGVSRETFLHHRDREPFRSRGMLGKGDLRRDMEIWQHRQDIERLEREYERNEFHKDKDVWRHQQEIERLEREYERKGFHKDKDVWRHQQEIDHLERELAKAHRKSSQPRFPTPIAPRKAHHIVLDSSDEQEMRFSERHTTSRISRAASPSHHDYELSMDQRMLERSDSFKDPEVWKQQMEIERLERVLARTHLRRGPPREFTPVEPFLPREPAQQESAMPQPRGDDDQKQTISEEISLPDNLEDLLAQWTTIDRQESQVDQVPKS
ncbi:uncharacterized protein N7484_003509 [Penicillium longicatenatum]|uniref:uncharacterized protein n=1 Tax=Penicillium longicatenatum TaxID=1561947 RepID=UPI002547068E|nr:uncharacterized protein N7484_003509 [Penicillium longicatenatum]KAJ5649786.1 hypothetical protein N7484_003509 [Penicillium longicatenatum]